MASYRPTKEISSLNPRREAFALTVIEAIRWRGRRLFLDNERARDLGAELRLRPWELHTAIDDLYRAGVVSMRYTGLHTIIELIRDELPQPDWTPRNGNGRTVHLQPGVNRGR